MILNNLNQIFKINIPVHSWRDVDKRDELIVKYINNK